MGEVVPIESKVDPLGETTSFIREDELTRFKHLGPVDAHGETILLNDLRRADDIKTEQVIDINRENLRELKSVLSDDYVPYHKVNVSMEFDRQELANEYHRQIDELARKRDENRIGKRVSRFFRRVVGKKN